MRGDYRPLAAVIAERKCRMGVTQRDWMEEMVSPGCSDCGLGVRTCMSARQCVVPFHQLRPNVSKDGKMGGK